MPVFIGSIRTPEKKGSYDWEKGNGLYVTEIVYYPNENPSDRYPTFSAAKKAALQHYMDIWNMNEEWPEYYIKYLNRLRKKDVRIARR
jgi:hypothetical protein